MKISACWIAKNEEGTLLRSIESLKSVVDELIVVDTGSTDNTVEIAKSAGARIEHFDWVGDFSAARNYAISLTSGDFTFFLDADEWFVPALKAEDRKTFEDYFANDPGLEALQTRIDNLNNQGAVKTASIGNRVLRKKDGVGFQKRVHEQFLRANGDLPKTVVLTGWALGHSGYVEDILGDKMKRNIELLETAAEKSNDPLDRHLQHIYLVREYYQCDNMQESVRHLRIVLDEPDLIRRQLAYYQHGIMPLIYVLIIVAAKSRQSVSRKEIYYKIVEPFKKIIISYPGVPTLDLFYATLFDAKEDLLLEKIGAAMEAARKIPNSPVTYYYEAEMSINHRAAQAALRRGKLALALDYSVAAFQNTQNSNPHTLHALLTCLHGQPTEEIIVFLNSQFDIRNPQKIEYLSTGTRMHGFLDVHAYYLNKKFLAGIATKGDYLYLLLLYKKYEDAVRSALEFLSENTVTVIRQNLFLAAICADDEKIYRDNEQHLASYSRVLNAFFARTPLTEITDVDVKILLDNYDLIAFAAGLERAEEFSRLFSLLPVLIFQIKAKYCVDNALYENVFDTPAPVENDYKINGFITTASTMTGRCPEALAMVEKYFAEGLVDDNLLTNLLAISDHAGASADVKARARKLYDSYMPLYDRFIDLGDVVRIGYITGDFDKKKSRALKTLTPSQFNKQVAEDAAKPRLNGLAELYEEAGAKYLEKSMPAMAMECYRFAVAQGRDTPENYTKLAEAFAVIGNYSLRESLKKAHNV